MGLFLSSELQKDKLLRFSGQEAFALELALAIQNPMPYMKEASLADLTVKILF